MTYQEFQKQYVGRHIIFKGYEDYDSVFEDEEERNYYKAQEGKEGLILAVVSRNDFDPDMPEENLFDSALFDVMLDDKNYLCNISGAAIEVIDAFPRVNLVRLKKIAQKYSFRTPDYYKDIDLYEWSKNFLAAVIHGLIVQEEDLEFVEKFHI